MQHSVQLHRIFQAPLSRVYRAFVDPHALVKWMAPHGFTVQIEQFEPVVNGQYKIAFCNLSTGKCHGFHGQYLEVIPEQRLRYQDEFDSPDLTGLIQVTIEFKAVSVGTEVWIQQDNLPDAIPVDGCYLGWQECLDLLSLLVTPDIPDE